MRTIFLGISLFLLIMTLILVRTYPDVNSEVPVLYWITDGNPAREQQIATFHRWLFEEGHVLVHDLKTASELDELRLAVSPTLADDIMKADPSAMAVFGPEPDYGALPLTVRVPVFELRADLGNADRTKKIIQTVSGVGSDVMDVYTGAGVRLFQSMGVIRDITDEAQAYGFSVNQTWSSIGTEIVVDGRQYGYPANAVCEMLWVNPEAFNRVGMETPPERWTVDDFERIGREYVLAANQGLDRPKYFFIDQVKWQSIHRSMGLDLYNETMTASELDDMRYVRTLELAYRWANVHRLMPTAEDRAAMATEQGFGGERLQMFIQGRYAMLSIGRYALVQFRRSEGLGELRVIEPPHAGFPNTTVFSRVTVIYEGTPYPELASLFIQFLASAPYNHQIVDDADSLPPNPIYTMDDRYLKPQGRENEWLAHGPFAWAAREIGIGTTYSPFILDVTTARFILGAMELMHDGQLTPEEAAATTAANINRRIIQNVERDPALTGLYEERLALQKRIDERLERGEPIPEAWVLNPFYRIYYREHGMLEMEPVTDDVGRSSVEASSVQSDLITGRVPG